VHRGAKVSEREIRERVREARKKEKREGEGGRESE